MRIVNRYFLYKPVVSRETESIGYVEINRVRLIMGTASYNYGSWEVPE
jgi:hypothetical protein